MVNTTDARTVVDQATELYQRGEYEEAARLFGEAASAFQSAGKSLDAAESKNNQSVAYLQAGNAQGAFDVLAGTAAVFEAANDLRRQGLTLGNEAAALEALGQPDEALEKYQQSAHLLDQAGEDQLRASVMKSISTMKVKRGKYVDALIAMNSGLDGVKKPTLFQRILRVLLHIHV